MMNDPYGYNASAANIKNNKNLFKSSPMKMTPVVNLVQQLYAASNPVTHSSLKEMIEKRAFRGECGRID